MKTSGWGANRGDTEMPKGITQEQVNEAADALVAAGENPTVEKIRAQLGTGSPNTIIRMLDAWRSTLAQRMQDVLALPEVPIEVGQAFTELWRLAIAHANTLATDALAHEKNALFAAQTSLFQERKVWEIALAEAQANVAECTAKLAHAEVQLTERHGLLTQLESQRTDLQHQRDRLTAQLEEQRAELGVLRIDRAALQEHMRTVEDRAHRQVDAARQEAKALQQRLEREQRESAKHVVQLAAQLEAMRKTAQNAEKTAARESGRVAALQAALKQWRTTTQRVGRAPTTKKSKPRAKKAATRSINDQ
jgi:DNA repair exonuclease SbcCD ATPase subunit